MKAVKETIVFSKEVVSEMIACHTRMAQDKARLDELKGVVKDYMVKGNIWSFNHDGKTISVSKSEKKTPNKNILTMITSIGLLGCLKTEIVPDLDRLSMEIGSSITKEQYDSMVKTTEVLSMSIK